MYLISDRSETTITSTAAVQAEAGFGSGPHFCSPQWSQIYFVCDSGSLEEVKVVFFLPHSEHYIRSVKTWILHIHYKMNVFAPLLGVLISLGVFIICQHSALISQLVAWLWFVLQIIGSQLACPVVLVTVFYVDRDQDDPTIPWECTRKADGSVIWAICLLWPKGELGAVTFLVSCSLLWRLFENCFAGNAFETTK